MKKRLIRADATQSIETIIKDVASDGRDILKQLENFKFKMAQCAKISVNEEINDKINQQYDMIDKIMDGLFAVCYDLENVNLVPQYNNDQIDMSNQDAPDSDNNYYDLNDEMPADTTPDEEEQPAEEESSEEENGEEMGMNEESENNEEENSSEEENIEESNNNE